MLNVAPCHDVEYSLREVTHDATAYYLREGESPGRWWGNGATAMGLAGEVDPDALRALFDGRDPSTGAYLVSARGSSVRAHARAGDADLDVAAVAARLELSVESVRAKLRSDELARTKANRGRWRVPVAAVDAWRAGESQPSAAGPLPRPSPDQHTAKLVSDVGLAGASPVMGRAQRHGVDAAAPGPGGRPAQAGPCHLDDGLGRPRRRRPCQLGDALDGEGNHLDVAVGNAVPGAGDGSVVATPPGPGGQRRKHRLKHGPGGQGIGGQTQNAPSTRWRRNCRPGADRRRPRRPGHGSDAGRVRCRPSAAGPGGQRRWSR